jgi:hypothetical protein
VPDTTTVIELPFTFSAPKEFETIDFKRAPRDRADATILKLQLMDPPPTDAEILHAVTAQQTMVDLLAANGAVYAGILVAKDDSTTDSPTDLMSVMLTVTIRASELDDDASMERVTEELITAYPEAETGLVVLPIGPGRSPVTAVLITEEVKVTQAVNLLDESSGSSLVRQLHVFVPIPGRTAMADFSISTESLGNWDNCVNILAAVCDTITLT